LLRISCALLLDGCIPDIGPPASRLVQPRVLAVRGDPAEISPGASTNLTLYVAGRESEVSAEISAALANAEWALCSAAKPPVDNNFVSDRCLNDETAVTPIAARGAQVEVQISARACALFGPETPPVLPAEPPGRPRDPDETGGYYQPVRVRVPALGLTALAGVRILCSLPYATPDIAAAYRLQYLPNRNPEVAELRVFEQGSARSFDAISAGAILSMALLPTSGSAETFLRFDPAQQLLQTQTEQLRVSWFAGPGSFTLPTTTTDATSPEIRNDWTAPAAAGPALIWAVLRDSRGGVAIISQPVQVR
jgi:hypothetical protein